MKFPDKWLSDSLPLRLGRALCEAWPKSLAGRFFRSVKENYQRSVCADLWDKAMDAPCATENSRYDGAVASLHRLLRRVGARIKGSSRTSRICKWFSDVGRGMGKLADKSRVLSALKKTGLRRLLIICFCLYLPVDYAVRNLIGIAILSSLWDEAFLLFCIGCLLWRRAFCRVPLRTSVTPLDGPILLYIALGIVLMLNVAPIFSVSVAGFRAVFQYMLWFFVIIRLLETDKDFECFCFCIALMITLLALHGIYQYIIGAPMPAGWTTNTEAGVRTRVYSITTSCNIFACLLVMCAPMVVSYAYSFRKLWQKTLVWGAVGAVCLALLCTFCRGAWFAMMITVFVFALLTDRRILAAVLACVPAVVLIPSVGNRIVFLFSSDFAAASAAAGRTARWATGMKMFSENLLSGFGLGRFGGAVAMQNQTESISYFYLDNYYLKVMVEEGLFGIILFGLVLLSVVYAGLRAHRRAGHARSPMAVRTAALLSGMIGVMVHCFTENILEVPYMNAYFWGFAAALCYAGFVRNKKEDLLKRKKMTDIGLVK